MAKAKTPGDGGSQAEDAQAAEFGAALCQTRIANGRELSQVAAQLRIRESYLKAIEDGRFNDLPGPTYAIGFVRAYADYLGLDENEVIKRYKEVRGGTATPANLVPPSPVAEARLPTGSVLLLAAVVAATAYGGWYYLSMKGRDPGEVVATLPDRIAAMVGLKREESSVPVPLSPAASPPTAPSIVAPAPPSQPAASAPAVMPRMQPVTPAAPERAPAMTVERSPLPASPVPTEQARASDPEPTAPPTPVEPEPPPVVAETPRLQPVEPPPAAPPQIVETPPAATRPPPPAPDPMSQMAVRTETTPGTRVVVRANESSWVEIRNNEDRRVFSRLMRSGETYVVPTTPGLTLTTGNAGGIAIEVDGKAMPPLGRSGDVKRDVALDADTLLRNVGSAP